MTTRAVIVHSEAWMGKEFGENTARRLFGDAIVDALPRAKKGKYIGKFKTTLTFRKVEKGGWVSHGAEGVGHVERRVGKIISAAIVTKEFGTGAETVLHTWTIEGAAAAKPDPVKTDDHRVYRPIMETTVTNTKPLSRPTRNALHFIAHSNGLYWAAAVINQLRGKQSLTVFHYPLKVAPDGTIYGAAACSKLSITDLPPINRSANLPAIIR